MIQDRIRQLASQYLHEIVEIRRHLHRHPELSFEEKETTAYLQKVLKSWGLEPDLFATTGLIVRIPGTQPGPSVVLRADIDALPIQEQTSLSYRSENEGVMHACGHDIHTASLLGSTKILLELSSDIKADIRILFQPAEELLPGGAEMVIASGVLDDPKPDFMIAQHVYPELPAGSAGFREGQYMASTDEIYIDIYGKGGHAAMPHTLVDPILIASHLLVALQQIVSRRAPAATPCVLSFGKFIANGATNVIPEKASLVGTFRTLDESWRSQAIKEICKISNELAESMGGRADCRIVSGYPSLFNDKKLTHLSSGFAVEYLGEKQVYELPVRMTGEDFARYSQKYPCVFYRLGTAYHDREINYPVHHASYEADEKSLETGMGLMAYLTLMLLDY